jgi:hypothetical protein
MPYPEDPSRLDGDELDQWYRRSPQDIERERQAAADERYRAYFGGDARQSFQLDRGNRKGSPDSDSGTDPLWIANGYGGFRAVRSGARDSQTALGPAPTRPDGLPDNPAASEDASVVEIGNPYNRRLKREWEAKEGRSWPKTSDGRNYHVSHRRAIADGGSNTLDNIEPMHPDEHHAMHMSNGDAARWAKRPWTARAFGGRVEPPTPRFGIGGLGALGLAGIASDILGIFSGRIPTPRPDSWKDMWYGSYDDKDRDV